MLTTSFCIRKEFCVSEDICFISVVGAEVGTGGFAATSSLGDFFFLSFPMAVSSSVRFVLGISSLEGDNERLPSCSLFSKPSTRLKSASRTSVFGPLFFGIASRKQISVYIFRFVSGV